jgi:hypothetical protein
MRSLVRLGMKILSRSSLTFRSCYTKDILVPVATIGHVGVQLRKHLGVTSPTQHHAALDTSHGAAGVRDADHLKVGHFGNPRVCLPSPGSASHDTFQSYEQSGSQLTCTIPVPTAGAYMKHLLSEAQPSSRSRIVIGRHPTVLDKENGFRLAGEIYC